MSMFTPDKKGEKNDILIMFTTHTANPLTVLEPENPPSLLFNKIELADDRICERVGQEKEQTFCLDARERKRRESRK